MYLYIKTADRASVEVALLDELGQAVVKIKQPSKFQHSEKLLGLIERVTGGSKGLKALKGIVVVKGPGGFTVLRVGATTANILGWRLGIPIWGFAGRDGGQSVLKEISENFQTIIKKKPLKIVIPEYGREPNITFS